MKQYFKEFVGILFFIGIPIILAMSFIVIGTANNNIIYIIIAIIISILTFVAITIENVKTKEKHEKITHNLNEKIIEEHTSVIMNRMMCNQALSDVLTLRKVINLKNEDIKDYEKRIKELKHKIHCVNNEAKELQDLCNKYETQYGKLTDQE